jgi:CBS domain-containing protein
MLVKNVMTHPVQSCRPEATVAEAAALMADGGVGCLPVVDARHRLIGIVTDRDVCVLVGRHGDPKSVPVSEIMTRDVVPCRTTDYIDVALVAMKENGVRRVPAVDANGHVRGLISIDDIVRRAGAGKGAVPCEAVVDVLRHICEREAPASSPL